MFCSALFVIGALLSQVGGSGAPPASGRADLRFSVAPALDAPSDFTGAPLSPLLFLRATAHTRAEGKLAAFLGAVRREAGSLHSLRTLASAIHERMPFYLL